MFLFFKAIKYDAVRSILSRFEVLFEDIVDNQKNANEGKARTLLYTGN